MNKCDIYSAKCQPLAESDFHSVQFDDKLMHYVTVISPRSRLFRP